MTGLLRQRTYELKDGTKRTVLEAEADDVSVSLKFATCKVAKRITCPSSSPRWCTPLSLTAPRSR